MVADDHVQFTQQKDGLIMASVEILKKVKNRRRLRIIENRYQNIIINESSI
jgi:hypothetical protein